MELTENKVSLIKRYPLEVLVVLLCAAVVFVVGGTLDNYNRIEKLNTEFKTHLQDDNRVMLDIIGKNTLIMQRNTEALEKINK